ncbi:tRNA (N6-threonylcarbamoyladenosine(37)-N6)-methyltransferase TrmO [Fusibacter paucivorans]|uniref:tRNA (N6-threonylcarbamoyladenosine(37)-N6)-methyltransferase TrmO n=1 Tax=Fusibacter paucivorans TaxID=76009 RepID=A0ABS5PM86_9FIRM|nr:tRNA (N6-threonylcarbamoyladenosine(37)-N6)-methyltransferase TrmO [Fusibacter paucivorans]MBS7526173.1 tRNA (N6-threonylcarbamoyladenosine(37)-N6)-methyltransferase TrmO [Fusibacter paucivorans]
MELKSIGRIESPYQCKGDAPRQGIYSKEIMKIHVEPEYAEALKGVAVESHIVVLYWGDRADRSVLRTIPPRRDVEMGVFACRSPNRPNPIALCVAEVMAISANTLTVVGLDALDGSPLLDIKPYVSMLDDSQMHREA